MIVEIYFSTAQGLHLKQRYVWLLCGEINFRFPTSFLFQPTDFLSAYSRWSCHACGQKHQPHVSAYLKFSPLFSIVYFSLFLSVVESLVLLWDLFGKTCYMMNPYLVRKFTLQLPTKITPECWWDNLGKQDHTREPGRAGATASLNILLFTQLSTYIHRGSMFVC